MVYGSEVKQKAVALRQMGYSFAEIAQKLKIAKSTASLWTTNLPLGYKAKKRLENRSIEGRHKSVIFFQNRRNKQFEHNIEKASMLLNSLNISSKNISKMLCALLFWCEGSKNKNTVRFTNSDPLLISTFLKLFRTGFNPNETKFRVLIHLHEYHDEIAQKKYWSKITNIPINQFLQTYVKPHTGINKHINYPGCLALYYYDANIAKELFAIYEAFRVKLNK